MKKIAVIGATGMLGMPVVSALLRAGFQVTALVRNRESARRVLPPETRLVEADICDEESLRRGLARQDAVYLNLSVLPTERKEDFHTEAEGLDNILAAARRAGVGRVAYLSALIHDGPATGWWVLEVWREAVRKIRASGLAYTIFYPTNLMETLAHKHLRGQLMTLVGTARHRNYWIAGEDYGRQVAASFAISDAASREYVIQGPEAMTYDQAARRFAAGLGMKVTILKVPLCLMRLGGLFSPSLDFNAQVMRAILAYPEEFKAAETWRELGKPSMTIEDFARSFAARA